METTTKEKLTPVVYVYAGRRLDTKNKLCFGYLKVIDGEPDGELLLYDKALGHASVGGMQTMSLTETGAVRVSGEGRPTYLGLYADASKRLEWQLSDKAATAEAESLRQSKKDGAKDEIQKALLPIRKVLARKGPFTTFRHWVIAAVLEELRRPLTREEEN